MARKRKRAMRLQKVLSGVLIAFIMMFAALSGVYCAKLYTTPYSSNIVSMFDDDTLDDVEISKEKCNILLLGTDKDELLTDVMMLAQIDPVAGKVSVMSIPRDTRIKYKNSWMKINSAHSVGKKSSGNESGGIEASILAVKQLTGIPVNHFVKINFDAFKDFIDEVGGVDFDVPQRMKYTDPYQDLYIDLQPGMQHLDGDKAEQLVRFRRYKGGDIDRIKVQQDFLHALVEQKLQLKNITKIDNIYKVLTKNMDTSMTPGDAISGAMQILSIGKDNIETFTLPNSPQYIGDVSYVIPKSSEIAKIREEVFGYDSKGESIN